MCYLLSVSQLLASLTYHILLLNYDTGSILQYYKVYTPAGNTCLPSHCSAFIITSSNSSIIKGYFFFRHSITTSVAHMLATVVASQETGQLFFNSSTNLHKAPANWSFSNHEPITWCRPVTKLESDCFWRSWDCRYWWCCWRWNCYTLLREICTLLRRGASFRLLSLMWN